jgi:hypothetical protein
MTSEESSGPSSDQTITEHELEECKRANATGWPPRRASRPGKTGLDGNIVPEEFGQLAYQRGSRSRRKSDPPATT